MADYKRLLNRFNFKGQFIELTHQELQRRIKRFTSEGEYNHMLVALKVFCNWAIKRRYIEHNPTLGLSTHATKPRSRVLTDAEIKLIWYASDDTELPEHFRTIVKLLVLTGQRRGEIAALHTSYIDGNTCLLPAELTKNSRPHLFPLGPVALSLLSPLTASQKRLIFPARGKINSCFNGWSKSKTRLDLMSGVTDWTLHDLRRTFRTGLGQLGVEPHIAERLVNHISSQSQMERVYDQYKYIPEMKAAIGLWEVKIQSLLLPRA